jgi:amidase
VADVARLFAVLADRDPVPPDRPPALAVATTWTTGHPATDAVLAAVVAALRDAGESVVDREVAVPGGQEFADELTVLQAETRDDLGAYLAGRPGPGPRSVAEVLAHERSHAEVELPFFGHDLLERAEASGGRAGAGYAEARARNLAWARETCLGPALEGADVLVAAAYGPAWKSDLVAGDHSGAVAGYATTPAAIAGWPVASVPVGLVLGLPVGMALIARPGGEGVLLEAARRVEAVVAATAPLPPPSWCPPVRG